VSRRGKEPLQARGMRCRGRGRSYNVYCVWGLENVGKKKRKEASVARARGGKERREEGDFSRTRKGKVKKPPNLRGFAKRECRFVGKEEEREIVPYQIKIKREREEEKKKRRKCLHHFSQWTKRTESEKMGQEHVTAV